MPEAQPRRACTLALALVVAAGCSGDDGKGEGSGGASVGTLPTTSATTATTATTASTTQGGTGTASSAGSESESATSGSSGASDSTGTSGTATSGSTSAGSTSAGTSAGSTGSTGTTGDATTGEPIDLCKVNEEMGPVEDCIDEAPPNSFEPDVQWQWVGPGGEEQSVVTPLVANLTDDDGNGTIDLCDTPDIVVVAAKSTPGAGHIYVLDGATGAVHFSTADAVDMTVTPALGDIDGDGIPEIVAATPAGNLIAFEHDGAKKWEGAKWNGQYIGSLGLADLDNDGDVEIFGSNQLFDHNGALLWTAAVPPANYSATVAADLDGDGDLELVLGNAAFHHDGTMLWSANVGAGFPQVADLDDDGLPEVLLTNTNGISLLEHDGAIKYKDLRPTGDSAGGLNWYRPATIHDFDGDDVSEFAVSSANNYAAYEGDASIVWKATVSDQSGIAAGTAFDFLGDGVAEAMYADEKFMFIFDGAGKVLLQSPRTSLTGTEYPIVADVDNDGSAEIVVVSNIYGGQKSPTVQVIRDKEDRWIQARRIWNQHTYHVTNVREDGTIPNFEKPSWKALNTFRTNAQIEGGGVCKPIPQ